MTFFNEENVDAKSGGAETLSHGPRVGFLDRFATAWDTQQRTSAQEGMWAAYSDEEDAQLRSMKKAGIENMPRIGMEDLIGFGTAIFGDDDFFLYKRAAKFYSGDGDAKTAKRMRDYDARIEELKSQYPDLNLKTGRELFDEVIRKGREAEDRMNTQQTTFGGKIGEFLGGGLASMNPRTDPLNAMTLGVGGPGKTALARIAAEAGLQGAVELGNQLTGVQEQRERMGLSHGAGDVATRVAGTALVGGAFQAVGEGLAVAGKRWFGNSKTDPAPAVHEPYKPKADEPLLLEYKPAEWEGQAAWEADVKEYQDGLIRDLIDGSRDYTDDILLSMNYGKNNRRGAARARLDMEHVSSRLEAWGGELPHEIKPKTMTAIPERVVSGRIRPQISLDVHSIPGATLDHMARQVDPKLFRVFDELADRKQVYKQWLDDPKYRAEQKTIIAKAQADIDTLSRQMDNLKHKMGRVGNRRRAEMQTKLDGLAEQKAALVEKTVARDTPAMAAIRRELIKTDEKMRDMYPEVGRAYAHARGQWELDAPNREAVRKMVEEGNKSIGEAPVLSGTYEENLARFQQSMAEKAPMLQQRGKVEANLREDADAADTIKAILSENQKVMDEALQTYRDSLDAIVQTEKNGEITINGARFKFDLDKDTVHIPLEDGTGSKRVTIRELLEDNADTEAELKATKTCSIL